jgi:hypothetical protein
MLVRSAMVLSSVRAAQDKEAGSSSFPGVGASVPSADSALAPQGEEVPPAALSDQTTTLAAQGIGQGRQRHSSRRRQVLIRTERTANHAQTPVSASHDRVHDRNCLASDWSGSIGDEGRHAQL